MHANNYRTVPHAIRSTIAHNNMYRRGPWGGRAGLRPRGSVVYTQVDGVTPSTSSRVQKKMLYTN